ncbi:MAG: ABC transporter substrate-binding protein [Deltaproteobacteria bacterium]|jgi:branched-chain amino acid transport system substrate-binding protein|nr:MAG: ABC transporter substrate-binding protein [Deltaproteobacteria bacterium]
MRRKPLLTINGSVLLALTVAALFLVSASATAQAADPIKIGFAATETGDIGPWWPGCNKIGKVALKLINEDPPLGRPFKVIVDDTESSPEGAIRVANYLGGQGVIFAVGYSSDGIWAALPVIERYGTPTFTQWSGTSKLDRTSAGKKRLMFRTCASDSEMAHLYGIYWEDKLAPQGYKKVAVLHGTDEASRSTAEVAVESLKKAGAEVVLRKEFPGEQTAFSRLLAEVFAKKPDAVFLGSGVEQGSIIMKEWWESSLNKNILWLVPDEWPTPEAVKAVTPAAGALDKRVVAPNPASGEDVKKFAGESYDIMMTEYQKMYGAGAEPEHAFAVNLYDAVILGALAIQAAGKATPEAVSEFVPKVASPPGIKVHSYLEGKKALGEGKEIDYEGGGSLCNFDEYGNVYPPCGVYMMMNGEFQQIEVYSPQRIKQFITR